MTQIPETIELKGYVYELRSEGKKPVFILVNPAVSERYENPDEYAVGYGLWKLNDTSAKITRIYLDGAKEDVTRLSVHLNLAKKEVLRATMLGSKETKYDIDTWKIPTNTHKIYSLRVAHESMKSKARLVAYTPRAMEKYAYDWPRTQYGKILIYEVQEHGKSTLMDVNALGLRFIEKEEARQKQLVKAAEQREKDREKALKQQKKQEKVDKKRLAKIRKWGYLD